MVAITRADLTAMATAIPQMRAMWVRKGSGTTDTRRVRSWRWSSKEETGGGDVAGRVEVLERSVRAGREGSMMMMRMIVGRVCS